MKKFLSSKKRLRFSVAAGLSFEKRDDGSWRFRVLKAADLLPLPELSRLPTRRYSNFQRYTASGKLYPLQERRGLLINWNQ